MNVVRLNVRRDISKHVHGIFCRPVLRRVAEIEVLEIVDRELGVEGGGDNVYPLVDAFFADGLGSKQLARLFIVDDLNKMTV